MKPLTMKPLIIALLAVAVALVAHGAEPVAAPNIRLSHVFSSDMVLQRDMTIPVWGWADPGEKVTVKLAGNQATATAAGQGKWMVELPSLRAGGPHELTVTGKNSLKLTNVLIGEV